MRASGCGEEGEENRGERDEAPERFCCCDAASCCGDKGEEEAALGGGRPGGESGGEGEDREVAALVLRMHMDKIS